MNEHSDPRTAPAEDLLAEIARIAAKADLDENAGDWRERAQTIEFIASRGLRGRDWGHAR